MAHLTEKFERSVTDPVWIRGLAKDGSWVILSGDTRIVRTPELKAEWLASGLTAFFLAAGWMNAGYWPQIAMLCRWWPLVLNQASLVAPGAGFEVPYRAPGTFKVLR